MIGRLSAIARWILPFRYWPSAVRETRIDLMLKRSEPKMGFPAKRARTPSDDDYWPPSDARVAPGNGRYLPIDLQEMPGA